MLTNAPLVSKCISIVFIQKLSKAACIRENVKTTAEVRTKSDVHLFSPPYLSYDPTHDVGAEIIRFNEKVLMNIHFIVLEGQIKVLEHV